MEKHEDNLGKLLKAELEKEAGEIMEEMDSDESLQDISFPEDLDEKMWSKIQEYEEQQKAYEKLSDADKEAIRLGREVQALRGGNDMKDRLKKDVESDSYIDNVVPIEHVKHEADNKAREKAFEKAFTEWIEQFKEYRNVNELDRIMLVLLVEKVLVYEKNRVEIIFRFKDEFETTMNYIRTMERCGRLTPSKEADERVVV